MLCVRIQNRPNTYHIVYTHNNHYLIFLTWNDDSDLIFKEESNKWVYTKQGYSRSLGPLHSG